ncbi:acetate kinase [Spiroplasma endosymbiont of 'Nebria riversi']|uniref:acetate kinase n=1 Tax=Spiroplasma endosymbiont of 'Nebria riversi' TaxID=2792084 RepID=UPI001FEB1964|nr:acetate kinase [Spiroplasma endosymbiont of 'Nebria riversi']
MMLSNLKKKILVINAGSSSIKFQLYEITTNKEFNTICKGLAERIFVDGKTTIKYNNNEFVSDTPLSNHNVAAEVILELLKSQNVIQNFNEIIAVGHRIVHGGEKIKESALVNDDITKIIAENIKLAPLHNSAGLSALKAFQAVANCPHIAVFDTTFHTTMPKINYIYPVPYNWYTDYNVRRYGFHGISYHYIINKLSLIINKPVSNINAIVCHLGNGASICAIKNGKSYNTSMGFTPLAGLMMGSRSGDIDSAIHQYIAEQLNLDIVGVVNKLNNESGLLGVSQISSDTREVSQAAKDGNSQAQFTLELYAKRVVDYISQYQNDLDNKVDAIVFTAGVGENSALIREMIIKNIKTMALDYNRGKNNQSYDDYLQISNDLSSVAIYAIRTNEELMICEETYRLLNNIN